MYPGTNVGQEQKYLSDVLSRRCVEIFRFWRPAATFWGGDKMCAWSEIADYQKVARKWVLFLKYLLLRFLLIINHLAPRRVWPHSVSGPVS